MNDPFQPKSGINWRRFFLRIDAWFDTTLFQSWNLVRDAAEGYSAFLRRFRVAGPRRLVIELIGDFGNYGTLGFLLLLALALPAFEDTRGDWLSKEDYSIQFLDRNGVEIGNRGIFLNDTLALDQLPDYLIKATLSTEDRRFFQHYGIDLFGLARAMVTNIRAQAVIEGGSTITQQLAKNLFLSNERTFSRKIKEAFLALWLEANLSKREILKLYLDRAYMGGGAFGVSAAAISYFDKSVTELSLAEAAMLSGLYKAPTKYAPHVNLAKAQLRANEVLTNMVQAGFMTEGQVIDARRNPAKPARRSGAYTPDYFLDYAFEEVRKLSPKKNQVLVVRTTLDTSLQQFAESSVLSILRENGERYNVDESAGAIVDLDGALRVLVGGKDYSRSQFNRATHARRPPGSSFKPFVYAAAMTRGYTPQSIVADSPITLGNWSPRNYDRKYRGRINLTTALVKSINTIPIRLSLAVGLKPIVETARNLGIVSPLTVNYSLPIGTSDVTVLEMAGAYAGFANGGFKAEPYSVLQIRAASGDILFDRREASTAAVRAIPQEAARAVNEILSQVPEWGTGRRAKIEGIRVAGKTGTTNSYRDGWFVGYTGNYSGAFWFGNDDFSPTNRLTGGSLPAMTWGNVMRYAHSNIELKPMFGFEEDMLLIEKPKDQTISDTVAEANERKRPKVLTKEMTGYLTRMANLFDEERNRFSEEKRKRQAGEVRTGARADRVETKPNSVNPG